MRLLICTQAVDLDDPVLGFFHRWIEEVAGQCDSVQVICLKEGRHALPANVSVHSLGKESGPSRAKYLWRFYRYVVALASEYDAVFVHMNQEYVLMAGPLWRLMGKRVVLWRNHKMGSLPTRIAGMLAHAVCYTSPSAYVASFPNAIQMPIGIDTGMFHLAGNEPPRDSLLFLGRLDAVKKPDVFLEAMRLLAQEGIAVRADVVGDPTPGREAYAEALTKTYGNLPNVSFHPGIRNDETPAHYASHALYCNLTPSGSFDKTIGEALASGCLVIAANAVVKDSIGELFVAEPTPAAAAAALKRALALSPAEREAYRARGREYVVREHSLALLTERLVGILSA